MPEILQRNLFVAVLIVFTVVAAGCISQQPEVLKVNPVIDYNPLGGYHNISAGMFTVIKGDIPEVKESLKDIIIKKANQTSTFSTDDELNFVVFRGVFNTGGYGINIDRVERQGNAFTVYATYSEPGKGVGVTEAVTQPVAIIPIGKLAAGDYKARLKVTRVIIENVGRKVIETEKELSSFNFEVKPPEAGESAVTPSPPAISSPSVYIFGQSFDEAAGNFTKKWDEENFAGFWHDAETGASTETLLINQSALNNSYRIIEKHTLIYTTRPVLLKFQVYVHANKTPPGTEGFYSAVGWFGDKYMLLQRDMLARVIFEQNATDVKTIQMGESWNLGDGYKITANSIDVPLRGEEQAWITFYKDNYTLDDEVLPNNSLYSYPATIDGAPVLVTYTSNIYRLPREDVADFKYTWLRSQNITEVEEGDIFGAMEVTSVKNDSIELRNKEPIKLAPGTAINLMGNMGIQVGSSETELQFYPTRRW